ncbi:MAG: hypothetical protein ACTIKL_03810 [Canibacter sp.]
MTSKSKVTQQVINTSTQEFADTVLRSPWGSLSKSELEFQVLRMLVAQGHVELEKKSDTALASELSITPARMRSLRFKWEQRLKRDLTIEQLLNQVVPHTVNSSGDELIIRVDSTYVLDRLIDELRSSPEPVLVRSLHTPNHVQVDVIDFWIKVNSLVGLSSTNLEKLSKKLDAAFPNRTLKQVQSTGNNFVTASAALANIASFLNEFVENVAKTP